MSFLEDGRELHRATILSHEFVLTTAEDDFNPEKKTLFATKLWEGAKVLGEQILSNEASFSDKAIIEFGAGAGLPSICAHICHPRLICCSDYPVQAVLDNIKENAERCLPMEALGNFHVAGYKWGTTPNVLLSLSGNEGYDIALAAECLWRHDSHDILLASLTAVVRSGGLAMLTFSHHVPGLETQDLKFFDDAVNSGNWALEETLTRPVKHMWSDRMVDMHLYILRKL